MTDLRADCGRCAGLCCVAPAFAASSDFAVDKPAGRPCPNLADDFRCGIHADLRERGFAGCTVFDCFGAGQQVVQVTFGGRDWRSDPASAEPMFAAFAVMRQLHELLWYLADALGRDDAQPVHAELRRARDRTRQLTRATPDELVALDVDAHRRGVDVLLRRASELVRAGVRPADVTSRSGNDRDARLPGGPDPTPDSRTRPTTARARRAARRRGTLAADGHGSGDGHPSGRPGPDPHGPDQHRPDPCGGPHRPEPQDPHLHQPDPHGPSRPDPHLHRPDPHGPSRPDPHLHQPDPHRPEPSPVDPPTADPPPIRRRRAGPRRVALRGGDLRRIELPGADLAGKDLSRADLRGASLRGACLIGADLTGADLRSADVIGADLRDADLRGADLTGALFLTRFQVNAAKGDGATRLPATLEHPPHWPGS